MVTPASSRSTTPAATALAVEPIVDLATDELVATSLLRDDPSRTLGDIIRCGTLERALGSPEMTAGARMAVRATAEDLKSSLTPRDLTDLVSAWGLAPRDFEVQISSSTEAVAPEILRSTDYLRTMGFGLTLLEFGRATGALMWLRCIPFDRVEMDASFSQNLGRSARDKLMCAAVVDLAHRLGASVDAAGLAAEAQVAFARAVGVERGRGRYWSA